MWDQAALEIELIAFHICLGGCLNCVACQLGERTLRSLQLRTENYQLAGVTFPSKPLGAIDGPSQQYRGLRANAQDRRDLQWRQARDQYFYCLWWVQQVQEKVRVAFPVLLHTPLSLCPQHASLCVSFAPLSAPFVLSTFSSPSQPSLTDRQDSHVR